MSDKETNIDELKSLIEAFVDERDWKQFHNPKNISMSISIEAAELMELFQWLTLDESKEVLKFAILAFSTINGIANNIPAASHASKYTILGKVSFAPWKAKGIEPL